MQPSTKCNYLFPWASSEVTTSHNDSPGIKKNNKIPKQNEKREG